MKTLINLVITVCVLSLAFLPADDAPMETYFLWAVFAACILWVVSLCVRRLKEEG